MKDRSHGLPATLRQTLTAARHKRRLSQAELGKLVGLPQMHVSAIETGRVVPRYNTLLDLVRVLDHDLLLVPRDLVPVVEALIQERNRNARNVEHEDEPLYQPDDDEEGESMERPS